MYAEGPLREKPLEYIIHCAGCRCEVRIVPLELHGRMVICPRCGLANPTPIFQVLRRGGL